MPGPDLRALSVEEGARLVGYAEAPRVGHWTLRSALVRYAQLAPAPASGVLEALRRTDGALQPHARALEVSTVAEVDDAHGDEPSVVALLGPALVLDELGDALAAWAHDRDLAPPHDAVRALATEAFRQLDELGVARETRPPRRSG